MKRRNIVTVGTPQNRRGAFLLMAMVCLVLTSALLGTLLKMAVFSRKAAQTEVAALQAEWLAESALDRAAVKLLGDANYQGETWDIPQEELGGKEAGQVIIAVKPGEASHLRTVEAIARFPVGEPRGVKRTKRIAVAISVPVVQAETQVSSPAFAEKQAEGEKGR